MNHLTATSVAIALVTLAVPAVQSADWPQWMGPNRDAVWTETDILSTFPKGGPKLIWKVPIAGGYAGPAVVKGKLYVTDKVLKDGARDPSDPFDTKTPTPSTERVVCLDAKTGKELWVHQYSCPYRVSYPSGPRCTPTVTGGKVYTLGTMGDLFCLDAETGKVLWQKDFKSDYSAGVPTWGFAAHPLVYKDLLICMVGGKNAAVVAFDRDTGKEVWKALNTTELGYCPPTLIEAGGATQLVVWHGTAINGLNPATGEEYWSVPLKPGHGMSIMAPRRDGDLMYAGGHGGAQVVLRLAADRPSVKVVWKQEAVPTGGKHGGKGLAPINATPFIEKGVLYGMDQAGMLRAAKLATGDRLWFTFKPITGSDEEETYKKAGVGTAFIVKQGGHFFLFSETGTLIIAKLSPSGYEELGRADLLEPTATYAGRKVVWSHPAFADKCVFIRNDKEVACYSLKKE